MGVRAQIFRPKDDNEFNQNSCYVMVHPRKQLWEENLFKSCEREEKHAKQLNLNIHNSNIEEKTGEEVILPNTRAAE